MAAPQVSGAAALVEADPGYNANQVDPALERAAEIREGDDEAYYGSGFVTVVGPL